MDRCNYRFSFLFSSQTTLPWPGATQLHLIILDEQGFLVAVSMKWEHVCFPGCDTPGAGTTSCSYNFLTWFQQGRKTVISPKSYAIHPQPPLCSRVTFPSSAALLWAHYNSELVWYPHANKPIFSQSLSQTQLKPNWRSVLYLVNLAREILHFIIKNP